MAARTRRQTARLLTYTADPQVVLLGRETIFRDGKPAGWLASGGFGYTLGKSIGLGYLRGEDVSEDRAITASSYELEVRMRRVPAQIHLKPLYDPKGERIRV